VLEAEMTHHLGYESGGAVSNAEGNTRNGKGKKKSRVILDKSNLNALYNAANEQAAEQALITFEQTWNHLYPSVAQVWRRQWQRIIPLFNYPVEICKAIYTTNLIESLNYNLKKVVKTRGAFPDDDALFKVLYLAINNVQKKWTMPLRDWRRALNGFATLLGDRLTKRLDTRNS
jgi:putative transposase